MLESTLARASVHRAAICTLLLLTAQLLCGCACNRSIPVPAQSCSTGACVDGCGPAGCGVEGCNAQYPITGMDGQFQAGQVQAGQFQAGQFQAGQFQAGHMQPGCMPGGVICAGGQNGGVPRELQKVSLHEYRIEPPDVLLIEAANNLRPVNDPIGAGEVLVIQCNLSIPTLDDDGPVAEQFSQINGPYVIGMDGYINLGPQYGKVLCSGQPLAVIQDRVEKHLNRILENPKVLVTLPDPSAKQPVSGSHQVTLDGTVRLGIYGGVYVAGMTLAQARAAIENHLKPHMHDPEVNVDVLGYNSKAYYVIADGGGAGNRVYKLPSTGNETVLDAIAQIRGLPTVSNAGRIWVARPTSDPCKADQVLHVDWDAIAMGGDVSTNYQLFPGDRLYVQSDPWIRFDTNLSKFTAPIERVLGFTILGTGAVRSFDNSNFNNTNN